MLFADTLAGLVRVTASIVSTTVAPVLFTETVKPGLAAALAILQQPSLAAQATIPLGTQPKVQVTDQFGNAVAASGLPIAVSPVVDCTRTACGQRVPPTGSLPSLSRIPVPTTIAQTQSISDTFPRGIGGITEVKTDGNGVATFSNLALNLSVGPWQLVFADTSAGVQLVSVVTDAVQLSPGPAASIVAWGVADTTTQIGLLGATLLPSVRVIDKVGNGVPKVGVTWSTDTLGSRLDNTTTVTDDNGIAAPGNWVIPPIAGAVLTFSIIAKPALNLENAPLTLYAIP
jgi:hypothetical protein